MKVKELVSKTYDKIYIYKFVGDDFFDIYKGQKEDIPIDILQMDVGCFGSKRKGILDIRVNI